MPGAKCLHCGESGNLVTKSDAGGLLVWCQTCFFVTDVGAHIARDGHEECRHFAQGSCLRALNPDDTAELCEICPQRAEADC